MYFIFTLEKVIFFNFIFKTIQGWGLLDITEHKRVEVTLQEEERFLLNIFTSIQDGICVCDKEFNIIRVNPVMEKWFTNSVPLLGKKCFQVFYNRTKECENCEVLDLNESRKSYCKMIVKQTIEDEIKQIFEVYNFSLIDQKTGEFKGIIKNFRDVTRQKEAEENLRESERRYRLISEKANDLIVILNENYELEYYNKQAILNTLGGGSDEMIGKNPLFLIHPDDLKHTINALIKGIENGEGTVETRMKHKKGDYIWLELKGKTYINNKGEKKGLIIGRDISDRKLAEQKLKESEVKYRFIYEKSPHPIALFDKKGIILECNSATEKVFGVKKNKLIGKNYLDLGIVSPEQVSIIKQWNRELLKGKELNPLEIQIKKKNGNLIWINVQSSIIKLDKTIFFNSMIQNITERKKVESMIKEEIEKLKELDQIRRDLITRVSHELKTPMVIIYNGSEILLNNYKDQVSDESLEIIKMIYRGSKRLNLLIANLLDASRIESSKLELKKKRENFVKIIKKCIDDILHLVNKRSLSLNIDLPKELYIEVDKIRIEQVIINILLNAVKNTSKNGKIYISLEEHENYIYITIKDTGVGFTKNEMELVFKKFGKIERYGMGLDININGSGLGLYISKEIVDLHGGKIWVESKGRNKGSTFIVKLNRNQ